MWGKKNSFSSSVSELTFGDVEVLLLMHSLLFNADLISSELISVSADAFADVAVIVDPDVFVVVVVEVVVVVVVVGLCAKQRA